MLKIYNYTFFKSFLIWWLILPLILNSCSLFKPIRKTIIEYKTEYVIKDSLNVRDSVIVVPVEKIVDIAPDTLTMETSLAKATAYYDSTLNMLRGSIENKQQIIYKYKYIDRWHTKDSLVYKEVPVEVEKPVKYVPNYMKGLATLGLVSILLIIAFILKKFHIF